jgi:ketosteroid isomerase-like protein
MRNFLSAWESVRVEAQEYRALDDERVLVLVRVIARGKASLGQMRAQEASLFHVRGGKVTKLVLYGDSERALADLGLASEESSRIRSRFRVGGQSRRADGVRRR